MKKYILTGLIIFLFSCNSNKKDIVSNEKINTNKQKKTQKLNPNYYNVAFLIMDGVYNTELTAPYDIFHHTKFRKGIKAMNVFTVANTSNIITSFEGLNIIPDYDYTKDELPKIDILVVPSAEHHLDTDLNDTKMLSFIKKIDTEALFITSHCDGAFVLAKTGILNNHVSTTFPDDIDKMKAMFPELDIRKDVLFVHDKKYITSAGGAKSFEAALYLCEYLYGKEVANQLAEGLVLNWNLKKVPHLIIN